MPQRLFFLATFGKDMRRMKWNCEKKGKSIYDFGKYNLHNVPANL